MSRSVLIIDDEVSIRQSLSGVLADESYEITSVASGEEALKLIENVSFNIILLDIWMPGMDGLEALKLIKEADPLQPVVVMSGHGNIETAVKATKLGAFDFVEKPLSLEKLLVTIRNAMIFSELNQENQILRSKVVGEQQMLGNSPLMREIREELTAVAPMNSWVLITGENGTGKELVARSIHEKSQRSSAPFIEVNCAAIPEELIESELFGHEKGAFTGATQMKRGKFDLAHNGTLFLDEIADMSLKTQAKILRILQEQKFERVGGNQTINVDVRVIAATNKNLSEEIKEGRFREDLYYRLNVVPILVPALRDRATDIPALLNYYFTFFAKEFGKEVKTLTSEAEELLKGYSWPGNVRELKNIVERLSIMTRESEICINDLPAEIRDSVKESEYLEAQEVGNNDVKNDGGLKEAKNNFEKEYIIRKLKSNDWNVSRTAQGLGIERTNLHRKLKFYSIEMEKE